MIKIKFLKKLPVSGGKCPPATQDLKLNTKNRNASIKAEHIQYGPLNLSDEAYWRRAAEHWNTTSDVAKSAATERAAARQAQLLSCRFCGA